MHATSQAQPQKQQRIKKPTVNQDESLVLHQLSPSPTAKHSKFNAGVALPEIVSQQTASGHPGQNYGTAVNSQNHSHSSTNQQSVMHGNGSQTRKNGQQQQVQ